jgi:hypothetical protein
MAEDARLGVVTQRSVGPCDELGEHRHERCVFTGEPVQPWPGGVDQPYAIVGEVGGLDDPGPRAGLQAGGQVLAVLLVTVTSRLLRRVGDRRDKLGHAIAELLGQRSYCSLLTPTSGQLPGVILDCVVQQRRADDVGVADAVVGDDADSDAQ